MCTVPQETVPDFRHPRVEIRSEKMSQKDNQRYIVVHVAAFYTFMGAQSLKKPMRDRMWLAGAKFYRSEMIPAYRCLCSHRCEVPYWIYTAIHSRCLCFDRCKPLKESYPASDIPNLRLGRKSSKTLTGSIYILLYVAAVYVFIGAWSLKE